MIPNAFRRIALAHCLLPDDAGAAWPEGHEDAQPVYLLVEPGQSQKLTEPATFRTDANLA